ncbi:MAG: hypothetical protein WDO15_30805 [Bacteroidota bacterium]
MTTTVELYFRLGEREKALGIAKTLVSRAEEMINYLIEKDLPVGIELRKNMFIIGDLQRIMMENGEQELADQYEQMYQRHINDLGLGQ